MKTFLKIITILLLLFNGMGAVYGWMNFIIHPNGSSMNMSLDWLEHTPFNNYLIPGFILLIANGLFSIYVLIAILFNTKNYSHLVIAQGVVLLGWIVIQVFLLQTVNTLHPILGFVGVALIILGIIQKQLK